MHKATSICGGVNANCVLIQQKQTVAWPFEFNYRGVKWPLCSPIQIAPLIKAQMQYKRGLV